MFKLKVKRLINDFGVKQNAIIDLINSDRVSFGRKLKDNTFTENEKKIIEKKYGGLF